LRRSSSAEDAFLSVGRGPQTGLPFSGYNRARRDDPYGPSES
jgi:hypothetical protein